MERYLIINSADRDSTSTSTVDFSMTFPQQLYLKGRKRLRLIRATIPETSYNITTNNQSLDFYENSADKTATLTPGYYNAIDMAAHLATQLTAASSGYATYTCSYSDNTGKITVSSTQNFYFKFSSGSNAATTNNLWYILGFRSSTGLAAIDTTNGTSTVSVYPVQLSLPIAYVVQLKIDNHDMYTFRNGYKANRYGLLLSSSSAQWEYSIYKSGDFDQVLDIDQDFIHRIDVKLYHPSGNAADLNNADWGMVFEIIL